MIKRNNIYFIIAGIILSAVPYGFSGRYIDSALASKIDIFSAFASWIGFALFIFGSARALRDYLDSKGASTVCSANMTSEPKVKSNWRGLLGVGGAMVILPIVYVLSLIQESGDKMSMLFILPISALFVLMGSIFVVRGVSIKIKSGE